MNAIHSTAIALPKNGTRKLTQRVHRQIISRFMKCIINTHGTTVNNFMDEIKEATATDYPLSFEAHCAKIASTEHSFRFLLTYFPMNSWEKHIMRLLQFCKKQNSITDNGIISSL